MTDDEAILEAGSLIDDRYVVEAMIGRGGMAAVYRVRHVQLDTLHAIKVLTMPGGGVRRRLMQEGRVQAALQHPNIVRVTDVVSVDGGTGLVMEYVRGPSLDALLEHRRPEDVAQIDAIVTGILDGVVAAHAHGLIHRDLKPANVMLAMTPDGLVPKVADFGLVKLLATDDSGQSFGKTRSGVAMGTPAYMAPEQIRDAKAVDERADVWSLGAILYEIVTGRRAYDGSDVIELFVRIAGGTHTPVGDLAPDLPDRMVRAIDGALQVDVASRIADVRTLRATWLQGATLSVDSPWNAAWLEVAAALGAGGDTTEAFLARSFRTGIQPGPGPVKADTWMPEAGAPTAVPLPDPQDDTVIRSEDPTTSDGTMPTIVVSEEPATPRPVLDPVAVPRRGAPWLAVGAAVLGLGALGVVGIGTAAWVSMDPPAPAPNPRPQPALVAPVPDPVPDPVPAPAPAPEPSTVAPVGVAPAPEPAATPRPEPVPEPDDAVAVVDPVPEPEPQAAPVPVSPARVSITGDDMTVLLRDITGRTVQGAQLTPGSYEVLAFFWDDDPERSEVYGPFELGPGSLLSIECFKSRYRCKVSQ